jgi:hypothetical protein
MVLLRLISISYVVAKLWRFSTNDIQTTENIKNNIIVFRCNSSLNCRFIIFKILKPLTKQFQFSVVLIDIYSAFEGNSNDIFVCIYLKSCRWRCLARRNARCEVSIYNKPQHSSLDRKNSFHNLFTFFQILHFNGIFSTFM